MFYFDPHVICGWSTLPDELDSRLIVRDLRAPYPSGHSLFKESLIWDFDTLRSLAARCSFITFLPQVHCEVSVQIRFLHLIVFSNYKLTVLIHSSTTQSSTTVHVTCSFVQRSIFFQIFCSLQVSRSLILVWITVGQWTLWPMNIKKTFKKVVYRLF